MWRISRRFDARRGAVRLSPGGSRNRRIPNPFVLSLSKDERDEACAKRKPFTNRPAAWRPSCCGFVVDLPFGITRSFALRRTSGTTTVTNSESHEPDRTSSERPAATERALLTRRLIAKATSVLAPCATDGKIPSSYHETVRTMRAKRSSPKPTGLAHGETCQRHMKNGVRPSSRPHPASV